MSVPFPLAPARSSFVSYACARVLAPQVPSMRCVFPALILGALLHAPTSLAAVSRRAFSNSGSSPAPSTLDFSGQPAQNVTLPNGQHPLTNDSPSLNLWTPAERAAFDKSVANFPDPVKTSACANYNTQSIVVYVYCECFSVLKRYVGYGRETQGDSFAPELTSLARLLISV